MKKLFTLAALIIFVFTLAACTKQDLAQQNAYQSNQPTGLNQEDVNLIDSTESNQQEIVLDENKVINEEKITMYNSESWKTLIPETCKAFFDGCNNCRRMDGSTDAACTKMYCEVYEKPSCLDEKKDDLTITYNSESWKTLIPETCKAFFDGCNNCRRMDGSDNAACTMMYCEKYEKAICLDENE